MTSKTTRYSQSITTLLAECYNLTPAETQALQPQEVFALIVEAHLGKRWVREIENWIEAVGGYIVWDASEEAEEWEDEVPFTHYTTEINYSYIEELDD